MVWHGWLWLCGARHLGKLPLPFNGFDFMGSLQRSPTVKARLGRHFKLKYTNIDMNIHIRFEFQYESGFSLNHHGKLTQLQSVCLVFTFFLFWQYGR